MISFKRATASTGNSKGVTLVELMVVIAVLGIIMTFIYSIFISQMQSSIWRGQLAERKQNLSAGMNLMISDFIKADSVIYNSGGILYNAVAAYTCNNMVKAKMDDGSKIGYWVEGDKLIRYDSAAGKRTVAEHINKLSFNCYDRRGQLMGLPITSTTVSDIRRIEISLSGQTSRASGVTGAFSNATITSSIELRNLPQYAGSGCGVLYFAIDDPDASDGGVAFCNPPGEKPTVSVKLCDLIGNATGGSVTIYPKQQPVQVQGGGVTYVNGTAVLAVPTPPAGTACTDVSWATALVNAPNPSIIAPGTSIEMVAVWTPAGCSYDIATSKSFVTKAGYPTGFKDDLLTISPGVLNACQSTDTATAYTYVTDACGQLINGVTVSMALLNGDGTGSIGSTSDLGTGKYQATYSVQNTAGATEIKATATGIYNAGTNDLTGTASVTNSITLSANVPDHLVLSSGSPVNKDECPGGTSDVDFEVRDACNNAIQNEASNLSASTSHGSMGNVTGSGSTYTSTYSTPSSCGAGAAEGTYNIYFDHSGISGSQDLTVPLVLNQCPTPGVTISVDSNSLPAGCPDEMVQITATIMKSTCEPDPTPAKIKFEVRNTTSGAPYNDVSFRNGRFETGVVDLVTQTKDAPAGSATVQLMAWDSRPGDTLFVHAIANVTGYGGAQYTSNEFQINVVNSPSEGNFYESSLYNTPAAFYDVPLQSPSYVNGTAYLEIRDCNRNTDVNTVETISAALQSNDIDEISPLTLTESGANTGVFRGTATMSRKEPVDLSDNELLVYPGGIITGSYTDADDPSDTSSGSIPVTGCWDVSLVNSSGVEILKIDPDNYPYDASYPDGDAAFHVILNSPAYAGNGITNTVTVRTLSCDIDDLTASPVDNHLVTLTEDASDNGIFTITSPSPYPKEYIYVGRNTGAGPAPGGNSNLGLRISPYTVNPAVLVVNPDVGSTCDFLSDSSYLNYGCFSAVGLVSCTSDLVMGSFDSSSLDARCASVHRSSSYLAKYYNFELGATTNVEINLESPGAGATYFDTYLYLLDSTGAVIAQDDDSGDDFSGTCSYCSRLAKTLPAGKYTIEATSYNPSTFGDYTVRLNQYMSPVPGSVAPVSYNFDAGTLQGWSVTGLWHLTARAASSFPWSVHYGQETNALPGVSGFNTGTRNRGYLTSPIIKLGANLTMSFNYSLDGECGAGSACYYDRLSVSISDNGGRTWTSLTGWSKGTGPSSLPDTGSVIFLNKIYDLSAYANKSVMIRFTFDSIDSAINDYEGAYVDSININ